MEDGHRDAEEEEKEEENADEELANQEGEKWLCSRGEKNDMFLDELKIFCLCLHLNGTRYLLLKATTKKILLFCYFSCSVKHNH